jgi:hypothetical protein
MLAQSNRRPSKKAGLSREDPGQIAHQHLVNIPISCSTSSIQSFDISVLSASELKKRHRCDLVEFMTSELELPLGKKETDALGLPKKAALKTTKADVSLQATLPAILQSEALFQRRPEEEMSTAQTNDPTQETCLMKPMSS